MKTLVAAAAALALVLMAALTGCDSGNCEINYLKRKPRAARTVVVTKPTVAVLPFSCSTVPNAGFVVADSMAAQLCDMGGCTVVAPEVVAAKAATLNRALSPEESGRLVGAPYVITGQVTEYVANANQGEKPAIGVTAQVINTATGEVVWTKTSSRSGSAAWYQEDNVGVLTNQVVSDLAQGINSYEWKTAAPVAPGKALVVEEEPFISGESAALTPVARTLPAANPVGKGTADLVESVRELPEKAGLIDFPEVPHSPDNFGLVGEPEKVAENTELHEEGVPSTPIGEGSYQDMTRKAPRLRQPGSYTMAPEEAARILDMFEDPYIPSLDSDESAVPALILAETPKADARPVEEVAAGTMYVMPSPIELTAPKASEEKTEVDVFASGPGISVEESFESVEPAEDMTAIDSPELVMPSAIEIPFPEAMEPAHQVADGNGFVPEEKLSADAQPSEELVPVSLGFFLDDDESRQPLQAPHAMALDDDDFMPKAVDADDQGVFRLTLPASSDALFDDEDNLDFFGKMSQNIGLDFRPE